MPASPRLIAGLSSSASAGAIGCTSGLDALELGALDFWVLDFFGTSGVFAMTAIWDCGRPLKRPESSTHLVDPQQCAGGELLPTADKRGAEEREGC
jgi:hypothetical protein